MWHRKILQVIIIGLPDDYNIKELFNDIQKHGINSDHLSELLNNNNIPLFLVVLKRGPETQVIFNMLNIGYLRAKIKTLKTLCLRNIYYRCQDFYHHSRFCNRTPKYLKCTGSHLTRDCKKTLQTSRKGALCRVPHPSNFSACIKNRNNAKHQPPPPINVWEERKKQQREKTAPQIQHSAQQINRVQFSKTNNAVLVDAMSQLLNQRAPCCKFSKSS
ncbi:RNA-directed DNA polymerase from mobile element jockey [Nephila pilipes]|uniref:RNA-directed DNA polymerase from mobile element jockey n=1 Tax=Nephila pilipes TaxID=299642 RepID=A0A8X6QJ67_NEPPI|nr:RNA-directed DNA polymerase from mobile element jockey [Nephila pilipes]